MSVRFLSSRGKVNYFVRCTPWQVMLKGAHALYDCGVSITNCPLALATANRQLPSSIGNRQCKNTFLGSRSCIRTLHTAKISMANHLLPKLAIGKFPTYQPVSLNRYRTGIRYLLTPRSSWLNNISQSVVDSYLPT